MLVEAIKLVGWQNLLLTKQCLPLVVSLAVIVFISLKSLQWLLMARKINKIPGVPTGHFGPLGNLYIIYSGMRLGWTPGESSDAIILDLCNR